MDSKALFRPHLSVLKILGFHLKFKSNFERITAYCLTGLMTLSCIMVCPCLLHFVLNNFDDIPRISIPIIFFTTWTFMMNKLYTLLFFRGSIEGLVQDLRRISMEGNFREDGVHENSMVASFCSEFRRNSGN